MVRVKEEQLKRLSVAIFRAAGASDVESETVSDMLVSSNLRRDDHGLTAIPMYLKMIRDGKTKLGAPITVLNETETTAMLDDGGGFGFMAGKKAMEMAIAKARKYKMGSVGVKGPGHTGALWYYAMMAVKEDMIGIVLCRSPDPHVAFQYFLAPYGGVEGRLGVNPFCIGIPAAKEKPIILDMATRGVVLSVVDEIAARGEKVPDGWLIRKDGTWSNDPSSHRNGETTPICFGYPYSEYKGYGLSVIVEALAGAIGSGCSLDAHGHGNVFTAIDPTGYCSIDEFKARIDSMIKHVKSSAKRPGFKEILLPGEPEWIERDRRRVEGVPLDDSFWANILETAKNLGVDVDKILGNN